MGLCLISDLTSIENTTYVAEDRPKVRQKARKNPLHRPDSASPSKPRIMALLFDQILGFTIQEMDSSRLDEFNRGARLLHRCRGALQIQLG